MNTVNGVGATPLHLAAMSPTGDESYAALLEIDTVDRGILNGFGQSAEMLIKRRLKAKARRAKAQGQEAKSKPNVETARRGSIGSGISQTYPILSPPPPPPPLAKDMNVDNDEGTKNNTGSSGYSEPADTIRPRTGIYTDPESGGNYVHSSDIIYASVTNQDAEDVLPALPTPTAEVMYAEVNTTAKREERRASAIAFSTNGQDPSISGPDIPEKAEVIVVDEDGLAAAAVIEAATEIDAAWTQAQSHANLAADAKDAIDVAEAEVARISVELETVIAAGRGMTGFASTIEVPSTKITVKRHMEGDQKLKTKLVKQGDSFGFELGVSAAGSKMVTKVHPGSKAAAGAELMVGDEIYFMNKSPVTKMTLDTMEAKMATLREAEFFTMRRPLGAARYGLTIALGKSDDGSPGIAIEGIAKASRRELASLELPIFLVSIDEADVSGIVAIVGGPTTEEAVQAVNARLEASTGATAVLEFSASPNRLRGLNADEMMKRDKAASANKFQEAETRKALEEAKDRLAKAKSTASNLADEASSMAEQAQKLDNDRDDIVEQAKSRLRQTFSSKVPAKRKTKVSIDGLETTTRQSSVVDGITNLEATGPNSTDVDATLHRRPQLSPVDSKGYASIVEEIPRSTTMDSSGYSTAVDPSGATIYDAVTARVSVTLTRDSTEDSYGFGMGTTTGGDKVVTLLTATRDATGELKVADTIISCNGVSMRDLQHDAALAVLSEGTSIELVLERDENRDLKRKGSISKVAPELRMSSRRDGQGPTAVDRFTVTVHRASMADGFGFGLGTTSTGSKVVTHLSHERQAAGELRVADTIVACNGVNFDEQVDHNAAVAVLCAGISATLIIERQHSRLQRKGSITTVAPELKITQRREIGGDSDAVAPAKALCGECGIARSGLIEDSDNPGNFFCEQCWENWEAAQTIQPADTDSLNDSFGGASEDNDSLNGNAADDKHHKLISELTRLFVEADRGESSTTTQNQLSSAANDGVLSKHEIMFCLDTAGLERVLKDAGTFAIFDTNQDGIIDWRDWFAAADTNSDNLISCNEFITFFSSIALEPHHVTKAVAARTSRQSSTVSSKQTLSAKLNALYAAAKRGSNNMGDARLAKSDLLFNLDTEALEEVLQAEGMFAAFDVENFGKVDWRKWLREADTAEKHTMTENEFLKVFGVDSTLPATEGEVQQKPVSPSVRESASIVAVNDGTAAAELEQLVVKKSASDKLGLAFKVIGGAVSFPVVYKVTPGGAADNGGVAVGMKVVKINGAETKGKGKSEVTTMFKSDTLTLHVQRPGRVQEGSDLEKPPLRRAATAPLNEDAAMAARKARMMAIAAQMDEADSAKAGRSSTLPARNIADPSIPNDETFAVFYVGSATLTDSDRTPSDAEVESAYKSVLDEPRSSTYEEERCVLEFEAMRLRAVRAEGMGSHAPLLECPYAAVAACARFDTERFYVAISIKDTGRSVGLELAIFQCAKAVDADTLHHYVSRVVPIGLFPDGDSDDTSALSMSKGISKEVYYFGKTTVSTYDDDVEVVAATNRLLSTGGGVDALALLDDEGVLRITERLRGESTPGGGSPIVEIQLEDYQRAQFVPGPPKSVALLTSDCHGVTFCHVIGADSPSILDELARNVKHAQATAAAAREQFAVPSTPLGNFARRRSVANRSGEHEKSPGRRMSAKKTVTKASEEAIYLGVYGVGNANDGPAMVDHAISSMVAAADRSVGGAVEMAMLPALQLEPVVCMITTSAIKIIEPATSSVVYTAGLAAIRHHVHLAVGSSAIQGAVTAIESLTGGGVFGFIHEDVNFGRLLCHLLWCKGEGGSRIADKLGSVLDAQMALDETAAGLPKGGKPFQAVSSERDPVKASLFKKQIHRADLTAVRVLGAGQFGMVYLTKQTRKDALGQPEEIDRAVKVMKSDATVAAKAEFLREVETMFAIEPHPNVVEIIGVALQQRPWLAVIEYMEHGDVLQAIKACAAKGMALSYAEQLQLALQVSCGMEHLACQRFVHLDLAARNCLLGARNSVKIGDFGTTQKMLEGKSFWKLDAPMRLPRRWMSPEAVSLENPRVPHSSLHHGVGWGFRIGIK